MWSWFGGSSAQQRKDAPKKAILGLRSHLEMLQKREKHLTAQMEEQDAIARKNVTANKNAAKTALRRKKAHEKALEQTLAQTIQIEQQIYQIEAANINQETLAAMKNAGKAMQEINKNTTIESVDQTMETLHEQRMLSDEIVNAVTSTPLGDAVDEDALDEEMESLEQEQLDNQMLKTGPVPVGTRLSNLPAPGQAEPVSSAPAPAQPQAEAEQDDDEAELEKLKAEMAI